MTISVFCVRQFVYFVLPREGGSENAKPFFLMIFMNFEVQERHSANEMTSWQKETFTGSKVSLKFNAQKREGKTNSFSQQNRKENERIFHIFFFSLRKTCVP